MDKKALFLVACEDEEGLLLPRGLQKKKIYVLPQNSGASSGERLLLTSPRPHVVKNKTEISSPALATVLWAKTSTSGPKIFAGELCKFRLRVKFVLL